MMLFFSQSSLQAHTSKNDSLNFNNFEISRPEFCLSSNCTDLTQPYLIQYTKNDFKQLKLLLQRGEIVLPTIERVLRENNVPDEFKYLAYIESNFNNHITSPSGAKGLWQFIKGTAVQNGLKVNNKTDERTNTEKSTLAAATYFKRLDYNYGDWLMVIAAYNCGEGAVNNIINKAGSSNFWDIYRFLPRQTQGYIAHYLGLVTSMNAYKSALTIESYLVLQNKIQSDSSLLLAYYRSKKNNEIVLVDSAVKSSVYQSAQTKDNPSIYSSLSSSNHPYNKEEIYKKDYFIYLIKPGDSINKISKLFPKNTPTLIKSNNNISNDAQLVNGSTILLEK